MDVVRPAAALVGPLRIDKSPAPLDVPATPEPPTAFELPDDPPAPPAAAPPSADARDRGARLLGRLALRGPARSTSVYLDGKRLLGSGARTFDVYCGSHTIAVGDKSDAHEVVVPCKGELVVSSGARSDTPGK